MTNRLEEIEKRLKTFDPDQDYGFMHSDDVQWLVDELKKCKEELINDQIPSL